MANNRYRPLVKLSILFLPLLLVFLVLPVLVSGADSGERQKGRYYEPVEVPGSLLEPVIGKKTTQLAVFSWKNATWRPIVFQIDEKTPDGKFILTHGPEANAKEADNLLDARDSILFMARDASEQAPPGEKPAGAESVVPVTLTDPGTGAKSWVYIVFFPKGPPKVKLEPVSELIHGPGVFNLRFTTYGYDGLINRSGKKVIPTIYINKLWTMKSAGGSEVNIIDRQKVRGSITFLGGKIKIKFDESAVNGGVTAYKPGPVRIITHSCMYPQLPMGIKGPKFFIDSILTDTLTLTTTVMNVPFDPGYAIHELTMKIGIDLTPDAKGMKYYNSVNRQGLNIDGQMDEIERNFNTKKDDWRLVTGPQGTQITYARFDPKFLKNGKASSHYNDNQDDPQPPENFPGEIGAGFDQIVVKSLETGKYRIDVFGCVPYHFYNPTGLNVKFLMDILNIQKKPILIKVGDKTAVNAAAQARILEGW